MRGKPLHLYLILLPVLFLVLSACEKTTPEALIGRAEQAFANRQYRAAVLDLKSVLQQRADDARARWLLAEVYLAVGDGASAEKELRRVAELGVGADAVVPALAHALLMQQRYDAVLAVDGGNGISSASAGELAAFKTLAFLEQGQLEQAKAALAPAIRQAPSSMHVRYAEARILVAEGDHESALGKLQEIVTASPEYADAWTLRGNLLAEKLDFVAAEEAYSKAIALRPVSVEDLSKRGLARVVQGKLEQAQQDAATLQAVAPKLHYGHYLAGLIHYRNEQLVEAQEALARAVELAPQDFASVFLLASLEARLGDSARGRQLAERAVAMVPNHIAARKILALWYLRDEKGLEAERMVRPIVEGRPDDQQAKNFLATSLMMQGKSQEASKIFEALAAAQPDSAQAQMRAGLSAMSAGNPQAGLAALEHAAEIAPEAQDVNVALVAGFLRQQSTNEALAAAQHYVDQKPDDLTALSLLAATQLAAGDRNAARVTYSNILKKDPGNLAANRLLASLAMADQDYESAQGYLRAGLDQDPGDLQLQLLEVRLAQASSDPTMIDAALNRAVNANPGEPEPRALRAQRYLEQNDPEKALVVLSGYSGGEHVGVLATRAEAFYRLGRLSDAKVDLEVLARLMPDAADVQWHLARVYAALGDKTNLARTLDRLLELHPDDPRANLAKARLLLLEGQVEAAAEILVSIELPETDADLLATRVKLARQTGDAAAEVKHSAALLKVQPGSAHTLGLSGAYRRAGRTKEEEEVLTGWLAQHPDDVTVRLELANVRARNGDQSAAIDELKRTVEIDPGNLFALNNLAWYLREESPAEARGYAERAYEGSPNSAAIVDTYAQILAYNGDFDTALRIITKAIDRSGQSATLILTRAQIRQMGGDRPGAIADVQAVLEGNAPDPIRSQAEALLAEWAN